MADKKPTKAQVAEFEMLWPILKKLLYETKELSKKKPDSPLNKLKVGMVNKVLESLKAILSNEPIVQYLEQLDNETLPTNSDAVFIIAQYDAAMEQYKKGHYDYGDEDDEYGKQWLTSD